MMRLPRFRYFAPTTVREALQIKAGEGPGLRPSSRAAPTSTRT